MNVTICSPFRDAVGTIPAYLERVGVLDYPPDHLRFVFVEGDSKDATYHHLRHWAEQDERATLTKCDTGKPRYGSIVNAERFQVLAQVFNAGLDAVDYEWSDYVLFLPSDIRYEPDLLKRLIEADKDIMAPFVWIYMGDGRTQFYDLWGFGRNGKNFAPFTQQAAKEIYGNEPIQMDMVGGTVLIKAAVLKLGCRYTEQDVDRGLCWDAQRLGFQVWAHPGISVHHPPFAPEDHGLTDVYSRDFETVKRGIQEKYKFTPPDAYIRDLIAFMSEMTHDRE